MGLLVALACYATRQAAALNWILEVPGVLRVMATAGLGLLGNIHLFLALYLYSRHVYRDARGEIAPKTRPVSPRVRIRRRQRAEPAESSRAPATAAAPAAAASPVKDAKLRIDQPHVPASTPAAAPAKADRPRSPADASHAASKRGGLSLAVAERVARSAAESDESDEDDADSQLSKAERRRQRKLRRREGRQA